MKFNVTDISFKVDEPISASPSKLRGFIGSQFNQYTILHNHYSDNKFLLNYPLVQYKIINDEFHILGINEGGKIIKIISDELDFFDLDKKYHVNKIMINEKEYDIKPSSDEKHYKFITPWLGLNQNNYKRYINSKSWKRKKDILNKVLVGNILSMSKGLGIVVNKRLYAKSHFDEEIAEYKSIKMNAFRGEFKIHYDIPDYLGLGKGVSQGFGTIKQIKS